MKKITLIDTPSPNYEKLIKQTPKPIKTTKPKK